MNNRTAVSTPTSGPSNTPAVTALTNASGNQGSEISGTGSPYPSGIGLKPGTQILPANIFQMIEEEASRQHDFVEGQQGFYLFDDIEKVAPTGSAMPSPGMQRNHMNMSSTLWFKPQPQQPNSSQNNLQPKQALKQLIRILKYRKTEPERQQRLLQILKSNPKLMAVFTKKQRQVDRQNRRVCGFYLQKQGMIERQQLNRQQQHQVVLRRGVPGPRQGQAPPNKIQNLLLGQPGQSNPQHQGLIGFGSQIQPQQYANFITAPLYQQTLYQQMNVNNNQHGGVMNVIQQGGSNQNIMGPPSPQHSLEQQMMHTCITADNLSSNGSDGLTAQDQLINFLEYL